MTPEFLRRYYILRVISNSKVYGIEKNGFVPLSDLRNVLDQLRLDNIDDPLYDKLNQYSQKTIKRDLEKIKSYYQAVILHKRNYGYYIEAYEVSEALKDVYEKTEIYLLHHHAHAWKAHVTTSRSSLSSQVDLVPLIHAIEQQFFIELEYQGWYDDDGFQTIAGFFQPLHLKEINKAWYLMAHNEQHGVYTFCLDDRIKSLKINKQPTKQPITFNPFEHFKNTIGVLKTGMPAEWIHIQVANHHFKYLTNNPLHHSQKIVARPKAIDTDDLDYGNPDIWGEIKVYLEPNYEFLMEILKYNLWVKVISPLHARDFVKQHLDLMMGYYN
ncbi:WYL domain-containing protein [Subsaximicrobium wynnwilliamsii]|uniref:WYL domain-containing protein n=1 Tax=Subsaximicrobium wynnwilliamsii TaxID=291179 RepID=A0A5C6ZDK1_9FLAO|nr:WYL domain-containing protein [Subsaximicrobium wynnwilliamsii]TXD81864.1 WYL domain-containing protein [Subsaximicrobium wynnwilliamsii]TXD87533.1 WYL domain-containing protein [Subsaximicrobium wynnwilliamsii]TXE01216.1 WYL domain-containing protein [Subsaximicrobium wynnwilliamsii]